MSSSGIHYERLQDDYFQILQHASHEDITVEIYGYIKCKQRKFLFNLFSILFLGIPLLICTWYPHLHIKKYKKCLLRNADTVLVKSGEEQTMLPIQNVMNNGNKELKYFIYQYSRYIWISEKGIFESMCYIEDLSINNLLKLSVCTKGDHVDSLQIYGPNKITVEVKSYCQLLVEEIFNPFYLFQIFSIILWSCDDYVIYAMCILILSVISIITSLYETKKQSLALYNLVNSSNCHSIEICCSITKKVKDDGETYVEYEIENVDSQYLVPGDIVVIPQNGCIIPCDAVLLSGSCIVNESMLTGESIPVTKTPPNASPENYDLDTHKRHTLFAGTHIIQTRFYSHNKVLAKVIRTGFDTSKGELVKSILYPKPIGFQFYKDAMKFVMFLSVLAVFGMAYTIYTYIVRHVNMINIVKRALDIVTVIVPPALPAAMTVGTIYSQSRLRKLKIFCISPPRINVCGKLKVVCFDKTGTLTHDGLEFYGVLPCSNKQFVNFTQNLSELDDKSAVMQAMATCHSLTRIDGELSGDPLDLSMFEATNWELVEPGEENSRFDMLVPTVVMPIINSSQKLYEGIEIPYEIGILRQFSFSSNLQCMSVICRILGSRNMVVFTKGAPEKIEKICQPDSIPNDFSSVLTNFTTSGYRVLAVAYKELPAKLKWKDVQILERKQVECDMQFLGLIVMQNALKIETTPIINELHDAKIRTIMVTGDNVMTAVAVSRDCGMVLPDENILLTAHNPAASEEEVPNLTVQILGSPLFDQAHCILNIESSSRYHIAMDGKTWAMIHESYTHLVPYVLLYGTIFARFSPEQKTQLVTALQELDYIVAMCGDGANDCGALKAAHIGVSLSQAEASVAAPFTSAKQDISCMVYLMQEGRCALVTSFAVFKYMAMYSIIQFLSILILYERYSNLGDWQFLYIDLLIITSLAITIGRQGPADILVPKRPTGSLVSLMNILPLSLQIVLCGVIQHAAVYYLTLQPWYTQPVPDTSDSNAEVVICWDNTVVFSVSSYQYIILACVYSKGLPYRQSIFTNGVMLFVAVVLTVITTVLLVYPVEPLATFFELIPISQTHHQTMFRLKILMFPLLHFILAVFIEMCVADCTWLKKVCNFLTCKTKPKNKYKVFNQSYNIPEFMVLNSL